MSYPEQMTRGVPPLCIYACSPLGAYIYIYTQRERESERESERERAREREKERERERERARARTHTHTALLAHAGQPRTGLDPVLSLLSSLSLSLFPPLSLVLTSVLLCFLLVPNTKDVCVSLSLTLSLSLSFSLSLSLSKLVQTAQGQRERNCQLFQLFQLPNCLLLSELEHSLLAA